MGTPRARTEVIQLVGRDGVRNNVFNQQDMNRLITCSSSGKDLYTVVSIIGPQSAGKSTLMNGIFNTNFTVMDASKEWSRTTKGIWASICTSSRAVVLDVEGTDSDDNQNDLGFETRSALFALLISDVIFFNICIREVSRANSNPLLIKIFEEVVKKAGPHGLPEQKETKFVVAVRNYNGVTPEKKMKEIIASKINKIWESIRQRENSKIAKYFKLHIELIPNYELEKAKFYNKCEEIRGCIARGDWVNKRLSRLPVFMFQSDANEIWNTIVQNRTLDLPSHRETMARTTCGTIMSEKFQNFQSSKYPQLTRPGNYNPRDFENQLRQILDDILSEYNNETEVYGHYADDGRKTLKTKILHLANGEYDSVMKKMEKKILESTEKEINLECQKGYSGIEERISSVVSKYRDEFLHQINGLTLYNKLEKENFLEKLAMIGTKKTSVMMHAKLEHDSAMKKLEKTILENTKKDIDLECQKGFSGIEERINYVVSKYRDEFLCQTKGLTLYNKIDQENFLEELATIGKTRTTDMKLAKSEHDSAIQKLENSILENTKKDIDLECQKGTNGNEERINYVVSKYRDEFLYQAKGFSHYNQIDQDNFLKKLDFIGAKGIADMKGAKLQHENFIKKLENRILENIKKEIDHECQNGTSGIKERINYVVAKYRDEFLYQTKGLAHYSQQDQDTFLKKLDLIGVERIADVKKKREEKAVRITKGVLMGLAATASTAAVIATGPIAALVGTTAAVVTGVTALAVAATSSGAAAGITAAQGQPHKNATVAAVEVDYKLGNTEANTREPSSPSM